MKTLLGIFLLINLFLTGYYSEKIIKDLEELTVQNKEKQKSVIKRVKETFLALFVLSIMITFIIIFIDIVL